MARKVRDALGQERLLLLQSHLVTNYGRLLGIVPKALKSISQEVDRHHRRDRLNKRLRRAEPLPSSRSNCECFQNVEGVNASGQKRTQGRIDLPRRAVYSHLNRLLQENCGSHFLNLVSVFDSRHVAKPGPFNSEGPPSLVPERNASPAMNDRSNRLHAGGREVDTRRQYEVLTSSEPLTPQCDARASSSSERAPERQEIHEAIVASG